jgi:hypothetical protein
MATAKISIEKVIHNAFTETAKEIFDNHGIRVDSINFSWLEKQETEKREFIIDHTIIQSMSYKND